MKKRVLVTGSTGGIGKETAKRLARKGWRVIVHGRNREKIDAAVFHLRETTRNPAITGVAGDLSSLKEVWTMSQACLKRFDTLDCIINNAGVFQDRYESSADGCKMTFAVNHLVLFS